MVNTLIHDMMPNDGVMHNALYALKLLCLLLLVLLLFLLLLLLIIIIVSVTKGFQYILLRLNGVVCSTLNLAFFTMSGLREKT
jgi:hypothetical protein